MPDYRYKYSILPLGSCVAFTFNSDHVNPQQSVQRFQCNSSHFGVLILKKYIM